MPNIELSLQYGELHYIYIIPEQSTVKAHAALFEGEGWTKNEALLFQSTVDIHFQNAHKTVLQFYTTVEYTLLKRAQNTKKGEGYSTLCVYSISQRILFHSVCLE